MKLLYYSTAYYAKHGGSTHSRHFFVEAGKHRLVTEIRLFPESPKSALRGSSVNRFRKTIRSIGLAQIFFLFRRNKFHYDELVDCIEKYSPDAVIVRLDSNFLQLNKLSRRFPDMLLVAEVNASPFDESFKNIAFKSYFRCLERKALLNSLNVFVSAYLRQRIMGESFDQGSNVVVHNGVDLSLFQSGKNKVIFDAPKSDQFIVGYIGTLDMHKRIDVLLRAMVKVIAKTTKVKLMIVGDGPERLALEALSNELCLNDHVEFVGWVPHDKIPSYIRSFDLAVHHYAEKYMSPLKLFEYLACEVPVIGPKTPAVEEVFSDGYNIVLTDGSKEDLSERILELYVEPGRLSLLASNGRELVETKYSWSHNADKIIGYIRANLKNA